MKLTRYLLAVALAALTTGAHAQAISALTGASALSGSEVTAVVQSATTKKATVDQFRTYILGGNTWTAGTGTLTLGAGKTATISNTLTFAGTDGSTLNVGTGGTLGTAAYTASSAYEAAGVALLKASNLSDLTSASTARTNLGLGTLATQSGTFSGTSSGTNTGDQTTITGNAGTATALQTARAIYGNNFDGTAALTGIIASTYGGTGNGFTKFTGPTTAERTFTLPDASATLLYSGGALGTPSGGTLTNASGLPSAGITMSTARLLGRTTASSGAAEEITVGSGLSLSAGTLTATGGSVAIGDVTGLGTNVATALAVNVGTAGAPVVLNGAGGTPSSMTGTNITGIPPAGVTGTAAILGANVFTALQTITQATANTAALVASGHSLTGSNNTTGYSFTSTLNTTGATYDVFKIAATVTATGANTNLFAVYGGAAAATKYFAVDGVSSRIYIDAIQAASTAVTSGQIYIDGMVFFRGSNGSINLNSNTPITSGGAAIVQQGAANAASPVAQTLQAQGSRSGTDSNVGGANYTIRAGTGTGTGTLSSLILQSPIAVASGTGAQTNTTGLTIHNGTFVSAGYTVATLPAAPSTGARAHVTDQVTGCAAVGAAISAGGAFVCPVFYNGSAWVGG